MYAKRLLFALLILVVLPQPAQAAFDWSLYASLLNNYVTPGVKDGVAVNLVDYAGLKNDPMFSQLLADVRDYDPTLLTTPAQRKAFYINAYNLLSLEVVTDHWPVKSIKDIGNPLQNAWDEILLQNMDGRFSLKGIREKVLMPMGDLRVLFAIDCNSVSGPNLRREPYEAARLDKQLDDQVRQFLSRTDKGLKIQDGTAHLSLLFDRYQDDFAEYGSVPGFIHRYLPHIKAQHFVSDLHYDWRLNNLGGE